MPISLDEYRDYVKKRNFTQNPSYYRMEIQGSTPLICYPDSIVLPGRNFINTPFSYYGPEYSLPLRREYNEMSVNFLVFQDWKERKYMEDWMDSILPFMNLDSGLSDIIPSNLQSKMKDINVIFNSRQKNSNISPINCAIFLKDAYPSIITPTQFSSENSGYTVFTVNFTFKYYTILTNNQDKASDNRNF
jgi:hypothetical protein